MAQTRARAKQVTFKSDATGGVVRYLHDKLSETVSVKDFGAVGDGVTDDTAAIQAAINASKHVIFPKTDNYYYCASTVTLNDCHLEGLPTAEIRGQWITNSGTCSSQLFASNASGGSVKFENLTLHGAMLTASGGSGTDTIADVFPSILLQNLAEVSFINTKVTRFAHNWANNPASNVLPSRVANANVALISCGRVYVRNHKHLENRTEGFCTHLCNQVDIDGFYGEGDTTANFANWTTLNLIYSDIAYFRNVYISQYSGGSRMNCINRLSYGDNLTFVRLDGSSGGNGIELSNENDEKAQVQELVSLRDVTAKGGITCIRRTSYGANQQTLENLIVDNLKVEYYPMELNDIGNAHIKNLSTFDGVTAPGIASIRPGYSDNTLQKDIGNVTFDNVNGSFERGLVFDAKASTSVGNIGSITLKNFNISCKQPALHTTAFTAATVAVYDVTIKDGVFTVANSDDDAEFYHITNSFNWENVLLDSYQHEIDLRFASGAEPTVRILNSVFNYSSAKTVAYPINIHAITDGQVYVQNNVSKGNVGDGVIFRIDASSTITAGRVVEENNINTITSNFP